MYIIFSDLWQQFFLRRGILVVARVIFQPKTCKQKFGMNISIMRSGFHYPPKKNAGPTKKFVVVKKCRSVVSAMKAFGTRTAQVTGMGCVKIDLGNGNFTTQREESGRCFNHIF